MSRAYRLRVSETVRKLLRTDDGIKAPLELLPLLPTGRMQALLGAELARRGFTLEGSRARRELDDGLSLEVDLEAGEVSLRVELQEQVSLTATGTAVPDTTREDLGQAELEGQVRRQLDQAALRAEDSLRQEATEKLECRLRDLRAELDSIVTRVTGEALKERARQLGEIEELKEDQATGAMTIRIRL